jgi:hypothetical protein
VAHLLRRHPRWASGPDRPRKGTGSVRLLVTPQRGGGSCGSSSSSASTKCRRDDPDDDHDDESARAPASLRLLAEPDAPGGSANLSGTVLVEIEPLQRTYAY